MINLDKKILCHITKKLYPNSLMIRFVITPSNILTPDLYHEFDGEEFYVIASKRTLEDLALYYDEKCEKTFQKENIISNIDKILSKRIISLIGLARKAGKVIIGYEKIQKSLSFNKIELLLQTKDGSKKRKKDLLLPKFQKSRIDCLNRKELGTPFGRDSVTNVGFLKSSFTNPLIFDTSRLESLRYC